MNKNILVVLIVLTLSFSLSVLSVQNEASALTENEENALAEQVGNLKIDLNNLSDNQEDILNQLAGMSENQGDIFSRLNNLSENQKSIKSDIQGILSDTQTLQSEVESISGKVENINDTLSEWKTSDSSGKNMSVYLIKESEIKPLSFEFGGSLLTENYSFEPTYVKSGSMAMIYVIDSDSGNAVSSGTIELSIMPSGMGGDSNMAYYMMQSGSDMGYTMSYDISNGMAIIPIRKSFGNFIMGEAKSPYYKSEQFFMRVGEKKATKDKTQEITIEFSNGMTSYTEGESEVLEAKKGGSMAPGKLLVEDKNGNNIAKGDNPLSFVAPSKDRINITYTENGTEKESSVLYSESYSPYGGGGGGGVSASKTLAVLIIVGGALLITSEKMGWTDETPLFSDSKSKRL